MNPQFLVRVSLFPLSPVIEDCTLTSAEHCHDHKSGTRSPRIAAVLSPGLWTSAIAEASGKDGHCQPKDTNPFASTAIGTIRGCIYESSFMPRTLVLEELRTVLFDH